MTGAAAAACEVITSWLGDSGLDWEEASPGTFVVTLPGERKLRTTTVLAVGEHALTVNAFVARHPDENADAVHRWLLERNRRMFAVSFAIDQLGDIYLVGRLPLVAVTPQEVDRLLGSVLEYSDGSFNTILELGFATAIRREWQWRLSRGESTANLAAFAHLADPPDDRPRPTALPTDSSPDA
ncbi:MAG: YbjN domain-containing protein [Actinomycetales bacterium]|nr:YbjN domain-containing protein [Actinomycetales bacterium]